MDQKTPSPLLRLRFHVKNDLPRAISASAIKKHKEWDVVVWMGRLYVLVDISQITSSGSKGAFMSLLQYAEEDLKYSHVIVCFEKSERANNKKAMRNFLFLGLQHLASDHEYLPTNPNLVIHSNIFF